MRKPFLILGAAITFVAAATYIGYSTSESRPEYVRLAEKETNNLLQSVFGPGKCLANQAVDKSWEMNCLYDQGSTVATYSVLPAQNAPLKTYDKFYLEAKNQVAVDSSHKGLVRYLEIGTGKVTKA